MDIKTLKYFVVVAEELNITRAAKILRMSQPPLSNQMKMLEEELGATLFVRGKRHLALTEQGMFLYLRAKDIIGLMSKTIEEFQSLNLLYQGTISIGLVEGMAPDIAAKWIGEFIKKYPNIRFRVINGNSDDLTEKLRSGLITLAVINSPFDEVLLNSIKVGEERMAAMISKDHPLSKIKDKSISVELLKNEPLIVPSRRAHIDLIRKIFRKQNSTPNIVCEMDNNLDAAALVGRSVGISIFPKTEYILNDSIVSKDIDDEDTIIEYRFVWRKGLQPSQIEENFINYIKDLYSKKFRK